MDKSEKKAVVLLSGGLDSTTCLSEANRQGYIVYALSFDYGQKHRRELDFASRIASFYRCKDHRIIKIDSPGGSSLTEAGEEIPPYEEREEIPSTYVPARNILFLSYALGYGEVVEADAIFIGVNAIDYSGYPDCRPEFIEAFQEVVRVGTRGGVEGRPLEIKAPLLYLTKGQIIKLALKNNAPLHLTTSCYRGGERPCGQCDSCILRLKGFAEAGVKDPLFYQEEQERGGKA